uniref:BPI-like protein n=1 Tax=Spironucleus salmonicida TaxID=348837 RepID=V6M4G1_9EUKA|eukprot:EST48204.1 hypothetical protein SS50377_11643 [Spironucleus salmonicida]
MLAAFFMYQCYLYQYDKPNPTEIDAGIHIMITNQGLSNYCERNIGLAISTIQSTLPPINFKLNLGIFTIDLTDGKLRQLNLDGISLKAYQNLTILNISKVQLDLYFSLQIQQKSFPYLQDTGTLSLIVEELSLSTQGMVEFRDPACKKNFTIVTSNTILSVKRFQVTFECGLQVILNSISGLLTNVMLDQLNGQLGQSLASTIMQTLLTLLSNMAQEATVWWDIRVYTDQRSMVGIAFQDNFLTTMYSGQRVRLNLNNMTAVGWLDTPISSKPNFYTDHDIQYLVERVVFNSGFQFYFSDVGGFEKVKKTKGITIHNITLPSFKNTGAKLLVDIEFGGVRETLIYLEPIRLFSIDMGKGLFFGSLVIELTNLVPQSTLLTDMQLADLASYFSKSFSIYHFSINNVVGVDLTSVQIIFLNENWIHVGMNMEK